jgi:hypothetical protein
MEGVSMSDGVQGRSRLVLGAIAFLALLVALAVAAGSFAPDANAKGLSNCKGYSSPYYLKVKNISCKKAEKKVTGKVQASWFSGKGVDWGKGCAWKGKAAKTCHFKVSGFKCTGVLNQKKYFFAIDCVKDNQRVSSKLNTAVG